MLEASLQSLSAAAAAAATATASSATTADSAAAAPRLEAAVRAASEAVVAAVAAQGWDAGSLGRLPPGVALPLREAFQRCRAAPPAGECRRSPYLVPTLPLSIMLLCMCFCPQRCTAKATENVYSKGTCIAVCWSLAQPL